jgi:alpha-tubulin suppressor-like RCC1 family protein
MILVVFSAPLDSASVDTGSIQLLRGTTRVSGTVRLADTLHLRAEFYPDSLLTLQTDYQLLVNQGIRDVNGALLDSVAIVPFTTGASAIPSNLVFSTVSVGFRHSCGVTTTGAAYCWGHNFAGELGTGSQLISSSIPALVVGGLTFSTVSASQYHTCGLTTAGAAYCWGEGGHLGDSLGSQSPVPLRVAGGHAFTSVSAALGQSCGVTTAGAVYCWGTGGAVATPTALGGGLTFASVSAGALHSCGVAASGAAYCWGMNTMGELGIGTSTGPEPCPDYGFNACSSLPLAVSGGLTFAAVSSGGLHTCGLTANGEPYCWGDMLHDLLASGRNPPTGPEQCADIGDLESDLAPDTIPCNRVPRIVAGDLKLASLSTGGEDWFACGLTSSGAAYCWGESLIAGSTSTRVVAVPGGLTFKMLSAGLSSTCGVTTAGVAYCWGANESGELGDGTTNPSEVPVKVFGQP